MRRLPVRAAVLGLALTAACGPHVPLNLAVQEVPLNILLGAQESQAAQQVITIFLPPPASLPVLLPPGEGPLPSPSPQPCPSAPPGTDPLLPASPDLIGQPEPGVYAVRTGGSWQPDVSAGTAYAFPTVGTMTVTQPVPVLTGPASTRAGEYTYSVIDSVAGQDGEEKVTTDFLVVPSNVTESAPAGQVVTQAAGMFITRITTVSRGATTTFTPSSPVTYVNLPLAVGVSWVTAGTDPTTGTTLNLSGAIEPSPQTHGTGRYRVDACGQVYDTWEVHATGTLVGPQENLTIDWRYDVATQYGGIELRHTLAEQGAFGVPAVSPTGSSQGSQVVDTVHPVPEASP